MTPQQALEVLIQVAHRVQVTLAEAKTIEQALQVINEAVTPKEEA